MIRMVIGSLLMFVGVGGMLDAWLNPRAFSGSVLENVLVFAIGITLPGMILFYFGRRARLRRKAEYQGGKKTSDRSAQKITERLAKIEKELAAETARIKRAYQSHNDADMAKVLIADVYERMGQAPSSGTGGLARIRDLEAERAKLEAELTQLLTSQKSPANKAEVNMDIFEAVKNNNVNKG